MKRESLGTERTGFNRSFKLPIKRDDNIPDDVRAGLSFLRDMGEHKLKKKDLDVGPTQALGAAISWIENLIKPQTALEQMKIYFNVGLYGDGRPGEIFIKADRSGSLASGALDAVAVMISIALQHGVSLHTMIGKLRHTHFEPFGLTGDGEFRNASSPLDLLAQWLGKKFPE